MHNLISIGGKEFTKIVMPRLVLKLVKIDWVFLGEQNIFLIFDHKKLIG